jgi:hypothetical protein
MSNPFTSVNRSARHLQTDHSQGAEYLCRDHDGLEGPLMSSAPVQITEGSCVPMPEAILQFRVSTPMHRSQLCAEGERSGVVIEKLRGSGSSAVKRTST